MSPRVVPFSGDCRYGGSVVAKKPSQKITHFFCRPCGEYHPKTHPHYRAQKRRSRSRKIANGSWGSKTA